MLMRNHEDYVAGPFNVLHTERQKSLETLLSTTRDMQPALTGPAARAFEAVCRVDTY